MREFIPFVKDIEKGVDYFWVSLKDGCFYRIRLNSLTSQDNYDMRIIELIDIGYYTDKPMEELLSIKSFHKNELQVHYSYDDAKLNYLLYAITNNILFEFEKMIDISFELYVILIKRPEVYIKYIDKLMVSSIFKTMLEGKFKR